MAANWLDDQSFEIELHPEIDSAERFEAFHEQVSLRKKLEAVGIPPAAFVAGLVAVVLLWGGVLRVVFGVNHPFVSFPTLAVTVFNSVVFFAGVFYFDRAFPIVVCKIRPAFEVDDETYYGFFGRMLERMYQRSAFTPIVRGPHGRRLPPVLQALLGSTYVGLVAFVVTTTGLASPDSTAGLALFGLFIAGVLAYASVALLSIVAILHVFLTFMVSRVQQFPVRLNTLRDGTRFGLAPYGDLVFRTTLLGLLIVLVTDVLGITTGNPLLLLAGLIATLTIVAWFVLSQYGLHRAIVVSKRERIQRLHDEYTDELQQVFEHTTDEPGLTALENSYRFIRVKDDIQSLPNWPTDVRTVVELLAGVGLANVPTFAALLL